MNQNLKKISFSFVLMLFLIPFAQAQAKLDKNPAFPGGNKAMVAYLQKSIKYPEKARKALLQGIMYVSFIVKEDGTIANIEIKKTKYEIVKMDDKTKKVIITPTDKPSDKSLEAEAIRVVQTMPKWEAGESAGKKVNVGYTLPVKFDLK